MNLKVEETAIPGVRIFTPAVHGDARGFFVQTYHEREYREAGLDARFVQDNHSHSCEGTVRGLHYQLKHCQAKLVSVVKGAVLDVAVDIRAGSPWFGKHVMVELSEENHRQLFVPRGFAHGFRVLRGPADFTYKCDDFYAPGDEYGVTWDDPALGLDWTGGGRWPLTGEWVISEKDRRAPKLAEVAAEFLPKYQG